MANSLKKNFGYNLILTFCNYLFPLLTYPYVSRVLGVEKIGVCNFVDGLINYFVLFAALGVSSYGVREIAKCRDDRERCDTVFSNLFAINSIGTICASAILIVCTIEVPEMAAYKDFIWIGLAKLVFSLFLTEWFFQGMQEFRYITIRSVFVRFVYVILIFVLVKEKSDANIYYGLTSLVVVANSVFNWSYSRRFRKISFKSINLRLFIIPVLVFGYYRILTSMYTSFNTVFLGFTSGEVEVGYFTTATKLYSIIMGVFTAFTTVMVPRASELLKEGNITKLQDMANKTFSLLSILALPMIIYSLFCADNIILVLSGQGYEGAILPFRIVIFLLLIVGMEQICIQQFLMASNSNKSIFNVSTVGAVTGILLNIILTPQLGAIGSSMAWGISELSVLCVGLHLLKKHVGIVLNFKMLVNNMLWSLLYIFPLLIVYALKLSMLPMLILSGVAIMGIFLIINLKLNKNDFVVENVKKIIIKHSFK